MSISYLVYKNDDPKQELLASISLSNTSHADWQDVCLVSRQMREVDTGLVVDRPFNTTIYDDKPLAFDVNELEDYIYELEEQNHRQGTLDLLGTIVDDCRKHHLNSIFV